MAVSGPYSLSGFICLVADKRGCLVYFVWCYTGSQYPGGKMVIPKKRDELLRLGVYSLADVAQLIGRPNDTVKRWIAGETPLYEVANPVVLDFYDLISLWVVSRLRREGVPSIAIRTGRDYLSSKLSTQHPFVHYKGIATLGKSFFGRVEEWWVNVGKSGQGAFQGIIKQRLAPVDFVSEELRHAYEQKLKPMEFGNNGLAKAWMPHPDIRVDPMIQSGQPCLKGTRVPALMIADLAEGSGGEEWYELIASDYALQIGQVKRAVEYRNLVSSRRF